jgi:hypothetical protein
LAAAVHASVYGLLVLLLTRSQAALAAIVLTHFAIDRFRLARLRGLCEELHYEPEPKLAD